MWGIENPFRTFDYVYHRRQANKFEFMAIINVNKYRSFPEEDRKKLEALANSQESVQIAEIQIKNPNNPVKLKEAKLITFWK